MEMFLPRRVSQQHKVFTCSTRMNWLINTKQRDPMVALSSYFYFPILKMLMIISALLCQDAVATMTGDYQRVLD